MIISTLTQSLNNSIIKIAIINANSYCATYKWKKTKVFTISMKRLEF